MDSAAATLESGWAEEIADAGDDVFALNASAIWSFLHEAADGWEGMSAMWE
jgi:hypothetical protein